MPSVTRTPALQESSVPSVVWTVGVGMDLEDIPDREGWRRLRVTAKGDGSLMLRGSVGLGPVKEPFWALPGLFWGDNLQDATPMLYPKFDPIATSPRAFVSARWQFEVTRLTQPLTACHDGTAWTILEGQPYANCKAFPDPVSAGFGFALRGGEAELLCSLPACEEPYRPTGTDYTSPKAGAFFMRDGDVLEWRYRVARKMGTHETLLDVLAGAYHGAGAQEIVRREKVPPMTAARVARNGLMNWHHFPEAGTFKYSVAYDRIAQQIAECSGCTLDQTQMFLGWVSGWVLFEPLLDYSARFDDPVPRQAVIDIWSRLAATVKSPSGFWWSRFVPPYLSKDGKKLASMFDGGKFSGWDAGWMPSPQLLHLRTMGDAVLRALRSWERHAGCLPFADSLIADIEVQAGLVAGKVIPGNMLPLSVDAMTGEPGMLTGTAGMIWLSIWARLSRVGRWKDEGMIHEMAGIYRGTVHSGKLHGAPEDVGECFSSEDVYLALIAYADLYEVFQRPEDLATACAAAKWLYLWRRSYRVHFSSRTILGAYGLNSRGGDLASAKNNHLHVYGLDVDRVLRQLSKWTDDPHWTAMAEDHWEFSTSLLCLEDGQFNGYEGMISEQYYFIDWSCLGNSVRHLESDERRAVWDVGPHFQNRGNLSSFSVAWCVALVLKTALERLEMHN